MASCKMSHQHAIVFFYVEEQVDRVFSPPLLAGSEMASGYTLGMHFWTQVQPLLSPALPSLQMTATPSKTQHIKPNTSFTLFITDNKC